MNIRNGGFTLIEVLVVVLIIGILAAVAVPQYQKAVEKSRTTQAFAVLRTIAQAQQFYYLANGRYATKFEELDVDIPWSGRTKLHAPATDTRSNEDWSFQIWQNSPTYKILMAGRLTGKYKGGGFLYYISNDAMDGLLRCGERNNGVTFTGTPGDYCIQIFKASEAASAATLREYNMP